MQAFNHYARYYDLLYKAKDYCGEAAFVVDLLKKQGVARGSLLELGCGTGRHALEFVAAGFDVHGVDLSDAMVMQAKQRVTPDLRDRLTFDQGDVRAVSLDKKFDAVLSLFHVVSYQTSNSDILKMFTTAANHLRSGGVFVFDCWYGPAVLTDRPSVRVKRLEDEKISVTRLAEPTMHPNENIVDVNYSVQIVDLVSRQIQELQETHSMRYFFLPELRFFIESAGLKAVDFVEWISGKPLSFSTWSATVIARKP